MGDATLLGKENCGIGGNGLKGEKKVSTGMLADITNLEQRSRLSIKDAKMPQRTSLNTNEYIEKLQKENVTLMKVLADRNKVIELSAFELQKMRTNLQKLQLQNLQLAQANSQMLAELNLGKDRLKALQHELGCKNGLLKAKNLAAEAKAKAVITKKCDKQGEYEEDSKRCNTKRAEQSIVESSGCSTVKPVHSATNDVKTKRQSARYKAEPTEDAFETDTTEFPIVPVHDEMVSESCPAASSDPSAEKQMEEANTSSEGKNQSLPGIEKANNKRIPPRRKSTRLKSQVPEPIEDAFELDDTKFPVSPLHEERLLLLNGPTSSSPNEEQQGSDVQELRRTSVGRPLRRAVEKVQSYKEIPLKVKMRRMT